MTLACEVIPAGKEIIRVVERIDVDGQSGVVGHDLADAVVDELMIAHADADSGEHMGGRPPGGREPPGEAPILA